MQKHIKGLTDDASQRPSSMQRCLAIDGGQNVKLFIAALVFHKESPLIAEGLLLLEAYIRQRYPTANYTGLHSSVPMALTIFLVTEPATCSPPTSSQKVLMGFNIEESPYTHSILFSQTLLLTGSTGVAEGSCTGTRCTTRRCVKQCTGNQAA